MVRSAETHVGVSAHAWNVFKSSSVTHICNQLIQSDVYTTLDFEGGKLNELESSSSSDIIHSLFVAILALCCRSKNTSPAHQLQIKAELVSTARTCTKLWAISNAQLFQCCHIPAVQRCRDPLHLLSTPTLTRAEPPSPSAWLGGGAKWP